MDARIRRRLRLRDLDTLIAVAETGSMARAAARLAVSQPAVSKAIAEMERTLGYRLLDRTAQGVEPNLYGRALLKWAKAVFDDVHQGVAELDFISDPTSGELRVAATGPIVAAILPVILERMRRSHPSIIFHVDQITSVSQQQEALRERRVDLIMGRTLGQVSEDFGEEILFHERTFVAAHSSNPLCRRRKLALRDLARRAVVPAAKRDSRRRADPPGVSGSRIGAAPRHCGHRCDPHACRADGARALSVDFSGLDAEIQPTAARIQGAARRAADSAMAGDDHDIEKSHD